MIIQNIFYEGNFIMAQIHQGKSNLNSKGLTYLVLGLIISLPTFYYGYLFFSGKFYFLNFMHLVMILPLTIGSFFINKSFALFSGKAGENRIIKELAKLPDDHVIFTNYFCSFQNKKCEIDALVLAPQGIFVIESKNHNGTINGSLEEKNWLQEKTGRNGGEYTAKMRNPVKQVNRSIYILSGLLRCHNINFWLHGLICFTNPSVKLNVEDDVADECFYLPEVLPHLTSNNSTTPLTPLDLNKITNILVQNQA